MTVSRITSRANASQESSVQAEVRLHMEAHLRHALEKKELSVVYQPVLDMSGKTVAAEALVRWKNCELGNVFPDQFIPLAEETGIIIPIGAWIMETACKQIKKWQDMFKIPLRIMINVSSRQFRDNDIVKTINDSIANSGIAYTDLDVEITEGLILEYSEKIALIFDLGIKLNVGRIAVSVNFPHPAIPHFNFLEIRFVIPSILFFYNQFFRMKI